MMNWSGEANDTSNMETIIRYNYCKFSEDWSHSVIESVIRDNLMARPQIRIEL